MRSSIAFFFIVFLFFTYFESQSLATVYDGGVYIPSKVSDHTDFGSNDKEPTVTDFGAEADRNSLAPVGKAFHIIGDDLKCYWGNFAYTKYEKALIIYTKTPLPNDLCVYQEKFDRDPIGFSISSKNGGVCIPTRALYGPTGEGGVQTIDIKLIGSPISLAKCLAATETYGSFVAINGYVPIPSSIAVTEVTRRANDDAAPTAEKTRVINSVISKVHTFTIQIASLTDSDLAAEKVSVLKSRGLDAFQSEAVVQGKKYYRVRIGQFSSRGNATQSQKGIADKAGVKESAIWIVKNE